MRRSIIVVWGYIVSVLSLLGAISDEIYFNPDVNTTTRINPRNENDISSDFGWRDTGFHEAIDTMSDYGTPLRSDIDGRIRYISPADSDLTKYIVVRHQQNDKNTNQGYFYLHIFGNISKDDAGSIGAHKIHPQQNPEYRMMFVFYKDRQNTYHRRSDQYGIYIQSSGRCYAAKYGDKDTYYLNDLSDGEEIISAAQAGGRMQTTIDSIVAGDIIGITGHSGINPDTGNSYDTHLDIRYGEFRDTANGNVNYHNYFCSPLLFMARPAFPYTLHFKPENTTVGQVDLNSWEDTTSSRVIFNAAKKKELICVVQSRAPVGAIVDAPTTGLDLNSVYFRIIPTKNRAITEENIKSWYSGTNEDQILSVFTYRGRGPYDFISNTNRMGAGGALPQVYCFYQPTNARTLNLNYQSSEDSTILNKNYVQCWKNNSNHSGQAGFDGFVLNTWTSKEHKKYENNNEARINAEARYPDGEYVFMVQTKNIRQPNASWIGIEDPEDKKRRVSYMDLSADNFVNQGVVPQQRRQIIIDNYVPYLEMLEIKQDDKVVYSQSWKLNEAGVLNKNNNMGFTETPQTVAYGKSTEFVFYFSEYMNHAADKKPEIEIENSKSSIKYSKDLFQWNTINNVSIGRLIVNSKGWADQNTFCGITKVRVIGGMDVAGNKIDGKPSTIAKHNGDGSWNTDFEATSIGKDENFEFMFGDMATAADVISVKKIEFKQNDSRISYIRLYKGAEAFINVEAFDNQIPCTFSACTGKINKSIYDELIGKSFRLASEKEVEMIIKFDKPIPSTINGSGIADKVKLLYKSVFFNGQQQEVNKSEYTVALEPSLIGRDTWSKKSTELFYNFARQELLKCNIVSPDERIKLDLNPLTAALENELFYYYIPLQIENPMVFSYIIKDNSGVVKLDKTLSVENKTSKKMKYFKKSAGSEQLMSGKYTIDITIIDQPFQFGGKTPAVWLAEQNNFMVVAADEKNEAILMDVKDVKSEFQNLTMYVKNGASFEVYKEFQASVNKINCSFEIVQESPNSDKYRINITGYKNISSSHKDIKTFY